MDRTRQKVCAHCSQVFTYAVGRGCDRKRACSPECRDALKADRLRDYRAKVDGLNLLCRVEGCTRKANRPRVGLCEGCYCRIRRNGDASWPSRQPRPGRSNAAGYVQFSSPGHPLAHNGSVLEHRMVLYAQIGPGSHACHWCGTEVRWDGVKGKTNLVVDHLNEIKSDNRPENLVPACNDCNRARGAMLPFLYRLKPEALEHQIALMRQAKLSHTVVA